MVDTPAATFSESEIDVFLKEDGYVKGTTEFNNERDRRYYRHGAQWAERDEWDGDRKRAAA